MTEPKPRRLILQRTGPAFDKEPTLNYAKPRIHRRILTEINNLLAEHIPQQSAAVRCALRQALEGKQ